MRNYALSFTEPYFLGYRMSAGFDVFRRSYRVDNGGRYDVQQTGGTIRFGLPITDNFSAGLAYNRFRKSTTCTFLTRMAIRS